MIGAYLHDSIGLKTITRDPVYHEPTYATVTIMGRVERKSRQVINIKGEQVVSAARVYLPTSVTPTHETLIVFDGADHSIVAISPIKSFSRQSHWEGDVQ